jgi:hypothetical protein
MQYFIDKYNVPLLGAKTPAVNGNEEELSFF